MFSEKLKKLRKEHNLTQNELAEKIYVSRSAICKWECGNGIPSDVNLQSLCNFFNVSEEWLLDRNDMKKLVNEFSNRNNKIKLSAFGIITSFVLLLISLVGIFKWVCTDEVYIALFIPNQSIFNLLANNCQILIILSSFVYVFTFIFSFVYWKMNFKYGKMLQVIDILASVICFFITFIVSYQFAVSKDFVLFFLR